METSSCKVDFMKPVLSKAGISLAITAAGIILVRIATRKSLPPTAASPSSDSTQGVRENACETFSKTNEGSFQSLDSESLPCAESKDMLEEIMGLRSRIEEMQEREGQLEKRFLCYQNMKDQEMVLMELRNKQVLASSRVESIVREVSLLDEHSHKFEIVAVEYLNVLRLLQLFAEQNEKLCKRGKSLSRRSKQHFLILRKQSLQILSKETEIENSRKELESKTDCISLMEGEIRRLKLVAELLQGEKDDLLNKLREIEESAQSKVEGDIVTKENYNQLASELEQLHRDEAAEVEELIYLRWSNACLRHELMRKDQEQEQMGIEIAGIEEFESDRCSSAGQDESSYLGFAAQNQAHSKRRKLIKKLKRWVEGREKTKQRLDEKEKGNKCLGRHSASGEAYVPARKSCSSA